MKRWICWFLRVACALCDAPLACAQTANWNGYYFGANLGGRFAVNSCTTYLACPNSGVCAGGQVGPDFAQTFNGTGLRIGVRWPQLAMGLGLARRPQGELGLANNRNANPTFFACNLGGNGDDRVFADVRARTHTVSLGVAYKF